MSIMVELPRDSEEYIKSRAARTGLDVSEYAASLLRRAALRERYDSVFGPVQEGFENSELSEEELTALVKMIREELWIERHEDANRK